MNITRLLFGVVLFFGVSTGIAAQTLQTEHVFLITLDGLRWQELYTGIDEKLIDNEEYVNDSGFLRETFWADQPEERREKLMPFFWSAIASEGQLYGNRTYDNFVDVTNGLDFSYPGYSEILTGFVDENINSNSKIWNPNKTLLEFVHEQQGFEGKVAAFGSWDVFPYIINSRRSGISVNAGFEPVSGANLTERERFLNELLTEIPSPWGSVRLDAFTHHYAVEHAKKHQPKLLYIAYGETDDFAHDGNYQAYIKSAHQTDQFIADLWEFVQHHPGYQNKTTFIITTDHGRGTEPLDTWRHHGSNIDGANEIWIAALGPDTPARGEIKEPGRLYQNQIAKTVARFLGLEYSNRKEVGAVIEQVME